jgi:hypothetical protein
MASTIYLHWTATHDGWIRPVQYHLIVTGDSQVHRLHAYDDDLPAKTLRRNTDSVASAVACLILGRRLRVLCNCPVFAKKLQAWLGVWDGVPKRSRCSG